MSMTMNEGNPAPNALTKAPRLPAIFSPTRMDMFIANIPGAVCAKTTMSRKSSAVTHLCLVTTSASIIGNMA